MTKERSRQFSTNSFGESTGSRRVREFIPLLRLHQQILQIQQRLLLSVHVDERRRDTRLSRTTSSTDLMDVIFDLLRHGVVLEGTSKEGRGVSVPKKEKKGREGRERREVGTNDNVLDLVEIKTFRGDSRSNHNVLGSGLEGFDSVLSLFLSCSQQENGGKQSQDATQFELETNGDSEAKRDNVLFDP